METQKRLQTVSFIYSGVLYEFTGVVGIEFGYPSYEEVAIGLKCMVTEEGNQINDYDFDCLEENLSEKTGFHYTKKDVNEDGSITYFISTDIIEDMRVQDSEEYYTEKGWCKEQVEDTLSRYL